MYYLGSTLKLQKVKVVFVFRRCFEIASLTIYVYIDWRDVHHLNIYWSRNFGSFTTLGISTPYLVETTLLPSMSPPSNYDDTVNSCKYCSRYIKVFFYMAYFVFLVSLLLCMIKLKLNPYRTNLSILELKNHSNFLFIVHIH